MSRQSSSVAPEGGPDEKVAPDPSAGATTGTPSRGPHGRAWARWRARLRPVDLARDAGMATAEYAIVTLAAAGFGGLLIVLLRSDEVRGMLAGLVRSALTP